MIQLLEQYPPPLLREMAHSLTLRTAVVSAHGVCDHQATQDSAVARTHPKYKVCSVHRCFGLYHNRFSTQGMSGPNSRANPYGNDSAVQIAPAASAYMLHLPQQMDYDYTDDTTSTTGESLYSQPSQTCPTWTKFASMRYGIALGFTDYPVRRVLW